MKSLFLNSSCSLKRFPGKDCVKILCNKFGFKIIRQRGSHIVLRRDKTGTVVLNHKELKTGTLKGILELAKIKEEEFVKYQ